jgi:hypothetical protein
VATLTLGRWFVGSIRSRVSLNLESPRSSVRIPNTAMTSATNKLESVSIPLAIAIVLSWGLGDLMMAEPAMDFICLLYVLCFILMRLLC